MSETNRETDQARTARNRSTGIGAAALIALGAALAVLAGPVGPASAATCDTSWSGGSGYWTEAGHWSDGLPGGAHPNACITAAGNYTVKVEAQEGNLNSAIASAGNLTLGGPSGVQTIAVTGTHTDQTASASLSIAGGSVGQSGRIVFSSNDPNQLAGTSLCAGDSPALVNEGVISFEGSGGARTIQGTLENGTGTINVNADTEVTSVHSCGINHLKNSGGGVIDVAAGATLTAKEKFTQSDGLTEVVGTMNAPGTDFTLSGGSFLGNPPTLTSPGTFSPSGGFGTFVIHGQTSFGTGIGKEIHVIGEATASEDAQLFFREAANHSTNAGTIELTSSGPGHSAVLQAYAGTAGSLVNTGTIATLPGAGGGRSLGSGITNAPDGTIQIGADTDGSCCSSTLLLTNEGALTIDAGKTFALGGALFSQTAGTTAVNGALTGANSLFAVSGGAFTGKPPTLTSPGTFSPSGGSGTFVIHGQTLFGTGIGAQIHVIGEATASEDSQLSFREAANHSTNAGTIELTSTDADHSAQLQAYDGTAGSLVNAGTIEVQEGAGGGRTLGQAITNSGTLAINAATSGSFLQIANSGTLSVAAGKALSLGEAVNQTAGQLIVDGALTTNHPVNLQGGTLRGTGSVTASTVANSGGTVHPGNSPGVLTIAGDYTQGAGGTLATEISGADQGSGYSRLAVSGKATLGGNLDVTTSGFTPAAGQAFGVLSGGSLEGTFASTTFHGGTDYAVDYSGTEVRLLAPAPPAPAPTPGPGIGNITPPPAKPGSVSFGKKPPPKTTATTAKFSFSAGDADSFECKLDKKAFGPCKSPLKLKKLKPGKHNLQVRGVGVGGVGPTARYAWTVKKKPKR